MAPSRIGGIVTDEGSMIQSVRFSQDGSEATVLNTHSLVEPSVAETGELDLEGPHGSTGAFTP